MEHFTRIVRPEQSKVQIDAAPKDTPSDGFEWPTFRLINKQGRVNLSPEPLSSESSIAYRLFAVANSKGWFTAAIQQGSSFSLIFSQLEDLRLAFKSAREDNHETFVPQRTLPLDAGKPNILAFACNDTRLFVSLEQGSILVYDTAHLFSSGSAIPPLHIEPNTSGPIKQILPNPGVESGLSDIVAIVRSDASVALLNMRLEPQGGWVAGDSSSVPVAVSWSPKGKHIAIGLLSGDILTYSLVNKGSPNKHIPPTASPPLSSITWLSPGHTFKITYGPASNPSQHIITLDTKSSTAVYYAPNHPFPISDRSQQAFTVILPKWDEDTSSSTSKSLVVVGDRASVDFEVLGSVDHQWYQQSQENPITLPLNKAMDDTMLLALDLDLTDTSSSTPLMFSYLNDGTIQGWMLEHTKPYSGIVVSQSNPPFAQPSSTEVPASSPAFGKAPFGQQTGFSTFGSTPSLPFGQRSSPAFGATGFGQPGFGQTPQPGTTSQFGQTGSAAFGTPSASPFGQTLTASFDQPPQTSSTFGSMHAPSLTSGGTSATSGFGTGSAFGSSGFGSATTTGAFGAPSTSRTGNGFGAFANTSGTTSAFGQPSFGFGTPASETSPPSASDMTREESMMSDAAPTLDGLTLGGGSNISPEQTAKTELFDSMPPPPVQPVTSSFGGSSITPSAGFGAFANFQPTQTLTETKLVTEPSSGFGAAIKPAPAFGQPSFGTTAFGSSGFGQPSFGQTGFGNPPASTNAGSGFGGFASATPVTFGGASAPTSSSTTSTFADAPNTTGFGGFASSSPTPFGSQSSNSFATPTSLAAATPSEPPAPAPSTFGTQAAPGPSSSPFGPQEGVGSMTPKKGPSPSPSSSPILTPRPSGADMDSDDESQAMSSFRTPSTRTFGVSTTPTSTPPTNAFSGIQSSSTLRPASGFGAFGSDKTLLTSPFLKAAVESKVPASVFGTPSFSTTPTTTPSSSQISSSPSFGSSSTLGFGKATFTPASPTPVASAKAPTSGGFGAFSGVPTGFGTLAAGQKKSFGELLKVGDTDGSDDAKKEALKSKEDEKSLPIPISAFPRIAKAGSIPVLGTTPVFSPPKKEEFDKEKTPQPEDVHDKVDVVTVNITSDDSFASLSLSTTSSFAEVEHEHLSDEEGPLGSEEGEVEDAQGEALRDLDESYLYEEESAEDSFTSSSELSDVPEEDEQAEEEEETDEDRSDLSSPSEPAKIPLPPSRSPSVTPQLEIPKIQITPSPASTTPEEPTEEKSTTPPGTPPKEPSPPLPHKSSSTSPPIAPSPAFGLGRPSTRPTRSSPLAATPVSLEEDEEEGEDEADKMTVRAPVSKSQSASPKPVEVPLEEAEEDSEAKLSRPGTPPLLSAVASPSPPVPPTPVLKPAPSPLPIPASPAPLNLLGKKKVAIPEPLAVTSRSPTPPSIFDDPTKPAVSTFGLRPPALSQSTSLFGAAPSVSQSPSSGTSIISGKAVSAPASLFPSAAPTPAPTPPVFGTSPWAKGAAKTAPPTTSLSSTASAFSLAPTTTPSSSPFGLKDKVPEKPAQPLSFGLGKPSSVPVPPVFGKPATAPAAPPAVSKGDVSVPTPPKQPSVPEGMQKECARLVFIMHQELGNLKNLVESSRKRREATKSLGGSRNRADLGRLDKWALDDIGMFGATLLQYEQDLDKLRRKRDSQSEMLREIQSKMLKAGTRKEEINRFNKAKTDKEFARMLKSRTLGPEHLEAQTQLRRNIRVIQDRIQQLEEHLTAWKKRLNERKSGRPSIKAPSLDTINRTYRNIDLAIQQQSDDIVGLTTRTTKLLLSSSSSTSSSSSSSTIPMIKRRDARLPDRLPARPIAKQVATTTAAALNAERSAQRLKKSLLAARKEPLLNAQAALASPAAVVAFVAPPKTATAAVPDTRRGGGGGGFGFNAPLSLPPFSSSASSSFVSPSTPGKGTLPESNFHPATPPVPVKRGATASTKRHSPGVPLKQHTSASGGGGGGGTTTPATSFSWGPLPTFKTASTAMVETVKITPIGSGGSGGFTFGK